MKNTIDAEVKMGLCQGRHEIEGVTEYVFNEIIDLFDFGAMKNHAVKVLGNRFPIKYHIASDNMYKNIHVNCTVEECSSDYRGEIDLYITGLTSATIAVIAACYDLGIIVTCYHYDRESGEYFPQRVN